MLILLLCKAKRIEKLLFIMCLINQSLLLLFFEDEQHALGECQRAVCATCHT